MINRSKVNPEDEDYVPFQPGADMFVNDPGSETGAAPPPSSFDDYIASQARNDLGSYEAPPPASPAQVVKQTPVKQSQEEPIGASPTPFWVTSLRQLPGVIANAHGVGHAKNAAGAPIVNQMQANNARNAQLGDEALKSRVDYANKVAALARKRRAADEAKAALEAKNALEASRYNTQQARLDKADNRAEAAEKRAELAANPDSDVNVRERALTEESADKAETRAEKLARMKNSLPYKGPALINMNAGAPEEATTYDDMLKAMADQAGGEDKVDPVLKLRAKAASLIKNPAKKAAAQQAVLGAAQTVHNQDRTANRLDDAADLKERDKYDKAIKDAEALNTELDAFSQTMKSVGVDVDNYKGEDIPGYGRFEQHVPNWMASDKQLTARRAALSKLANRIYAQSGKAVTEQERRILASIEGLADNMDERQLIDAYKAERKIVASIRERAGRSFPEGAQSYNANNPPTTPEPTTAAQGGTITVRDPKTGKTGAFKNTPALQEKLKSKVLELVSQ